MTQLSILQVADFANKDRKTIYKAIKQGKLSATKATDGGLQVEISEVIRVYGEKLPKAVASDIMATVSSPQMETSQGDKIRLAILETENQQLRERLDDMKATIQLLGFDRQTSKKPWWKF